MDANGLRSYGLWLDTPEGGGGLVRWPLGPDNARVETLEPALQHRVPGVRLASAAPALALAETATDPNAAPPVVALRDAFGHALVWQAAGAQLLSLPARTADGQLPDPVPVAVPGAPAVVHDLAMSTGDVVFIASGALALLDTRARFPGRTVTLPSGFSARRLAADAEGGVYLLDTTNGRLLHLSGQPLPATGVRSGRAADSFSAQDLNPEPLRLREWASAVLPAGEQAMDIACSAEGLLMLLSAAGGRSQLRALTEAGAWSDPLPLATPALAYTLGWLDAQRVAVLSRATLLDAGGTPQPGRDPGAFDFVIDAATREGLRQRGVAPGTLLAPSGEYYPLVARLEAPLVRSAAALVAGRGGAGARLFYARQPERAGAPMEPAPLARLSGTTRAPYGLAANSPRRVEGEPARRVRPEPGVIDTGELTTAWHRLYVEACVPRHTAILVWLAANDGAPPPFRPWATGGGLPGRSGWYPHLLGQPGALPASMRAALPADLPRAAWVDSASEVPQGASLLACEREAGTTGLFTVLVQRAGLAVRTLAGRRLWVTAELFGDGRASPELVALRSYAGRVSYRDRHLPALYREQVFGPEADLPGSATGADFLERFIDLFEGLFTGIEDRIAQSYRLTDAYAAPAEALPWLASWIGLALAPGVPEARARRMIAAAPQLARRHGTLEGLKAALDLATDGAVTHGRIVVVEDFRLRRTMATLLGVRLDDLADPLVAGVTRNGNSVVGDTLMLGDEHQVKTFLALFRTLEPDPKAGQAVQQRQDDERAAALHALYDGLAWRATVLVHDETDDDTLRLVRRLAEAAAPAHVRIRVAPARYPFLAAVASLVGADTFMRAPEPPQPVQVDRSRLGFVDTLQGLGTLDARGGAFTSPTA